MPTLSTRAALLPDLTVPPLRLLRTRPTDQQLEGTEALLLMLHAALAGEAARAAGKALVAAAIAQDFALRAVIEEAGRRSAERVHSRDYDVDLESGVADVLQCAVDGKGDHILATRFLQRFVPPESTWLHIDLSSATRARGLGHVTSDITGFGVRFALEALGGADQLGAPTR